MTDRIVGLAFLALSVWYGVTAGNYEASFGDPLGPAAFPMIIAVPAAVMSVAMILRPDPDPAFARGWPLARQLTSLAVLLGYALLLERLGFPLATMLATALLARLIGARWKQAVVSAVAIAFSLYFAFDHLLGLPLPFYPDIMG
ncbi:MAG: tripartite tricarboxylate transporter TctB family protein [Paracoccaceae bacterium]|jgi:putative tricarboxylic transport membrane protein